MAGKISIELVGSHVVFKTKFIIVSELEFRADWFVGRYWSTTKCLPTNYGRDASDLLAERLQ